MIKLPINSKWSQLNSSDKFGSLFYTKNINLDEEGYIRLSPRAVNLFDDSGSVTNISSTNFSTPVAFGRYSEGSFRLATTDEPFNIVISTTSKSISEDTSSNNPNLNAMSHGCWWQNRFYESTDTAVSYNTAGTWTANAITSLTSGVKHPLCVFRNRRTLVVGNGNVVKQYDTSHSGTTDLTLPSDYEVTGLVYNNYRVGIITRLGSDSAGQNADAYFFTWDGATTEANSGISIGAYNSFSIIPYKGTFLLITSTGEFKLYTGGGFETVAYLPYYASEKSIDDLLNNLSYGDNSVVDGDVVYSNLNFGLSASGRKLDRHLPQNPSGVWCFDPKVGLYHRYSMSNSKVYFHTVSQANVDTSTNIFTTSVTIPATGNPMVLSSGTVGGITANKVYYVIKLSATTFAIAETKDLAEASVKIDITSADTNQYFWILDLTDYGISYAGNPAGAIALYGTQRSIYSDIIFGGKIYDTSLNSQDTLCGIFPMLEGRGYFVTPKIYADSLSDTATDLIIKHRPLDTNDKIIVKVKTKDILGLPTSTPNGISSGSRLTWTSDREGYTTADLSEAKTYFDSHEDEELECEFTAGAGAGQLVKITGIGESGGTYSLTFAERVVGASAGLLSHILIENWTTLATIDTDTQESDNVYTVPIAKNSKWFMYKIELRGFQTTIEDMGFNNKQHSS